MKTFRLIALIFIACQQVSAQQALSGFLEGPVKGHLCQAIVEQSDTIPYITLEPVYVYTSYLFKNAEEQRAWFRIKRRVQKVYPYAVLAGLQIREMDQNLEHIKDSKKQKAYLKAEETRLKKEFELELKALNFYEGQILIKLINRETGKTTYDIVKQFKGSFQAFLYQGVARLFGYNTKETYSAAFEDLMIERAVQEVIRGS